MRPFESLFVVALVLYSVAIWSHKLRGQLKPWMVWIFGTAFIFDLFATIVVCVLVDPTRELNLHAVIGFLSLLIMGLHFFWAFGAVMLRGDLEKYFSRYSVYAWFLWLVAFFSGIPLA